MSSTYTIFKSGAFTSHSGVLLPDKIECDALMVGDWGCMAAWVARHMTFQNVVGVPRGGLEFAAALQQYCKPDGHWHVLIVDDVLTTGASMERMREQYPGAAGAVIYARGQLPDWVIARFLDTEGK